MLLLILYQNTISKTFCFPPVPHFNHLTTNYVIFAKDICRIGTEFSKIAKPRVTTPLFLLSD